MPPGAEIPATKQCYAGVQQKDMANHLQQYLRTTRWVTAQSTIKISDRCRIRNYSESEAERTAQVVRKRNVNARVSGPRDFYYKRAMNLGGQTVVEITNDPQVLPAERLNRQAKLAESVLIASTLLQGDRKSFVRSVVGVREEFLDLTITAEGARKTSVSSTSQSGEEPSGLTVDDKTTRRFQKNGFAGLYEMANGDRKLSTRLERALDWLIQSRTDRSVSSAIVKTSTALEALIVRGREPTRRALSERGAYILSDDPDKRRRISRAIKTFYSKRGDIVHGKEIVSDDDTVRILEFGDRLSVLIALVLSANGDRWSNADDVRQHCDAVRWGDDRTCLRPWGSRYLNAALNRLP